MTRLFILALPLVLIACSGSGDDTLAMQAPEAGQEGVCNTAYYSELRGDYRGQIEYTGPTSACAWNVDLQISTQLQPVGQCLTFVSITSELLSSDFGDSTRCSDIGTSAQLDEPYIAEQSLSSLNNPVWPVDVNVTLSTALDADKLFPVGQTGSVQLLTLRFDGSGNMTFPVVTSADEAFAGVLVKQIERVNSRW